MDLILGFSKNSFLFSVYFFEIRQTKKKARVQIMYTFASVCILPDNGFVFVDKLSVVFIIFFLLSSTNKEE